jgi:hypothetical protein
MSAPLIVRNRADTDADRHEAAPMAHDLGFQTPDELLAGLNKFHGSQNAMPKSG